MFKTIHVMLLHAMNESGTSPERRYDAASKLMHFALSSTNPTWQHKTLQKALDVILREGTFESMPKQTSSHRKFWKLGHGITMEILKHQEILNIPSYWLSDDYDDVVAIM